MTLSLFNPHSALAVLQRRPRGALRLTLPREGGGPAWHRVADAARMRGLPVSTGSAALEIEPRSGVSPAELFAGAAQRAGGRGLWLALDCLQDPHNVGAVFRSAAFFGVQGVLLTKDRSAQLTAVVYDTASGGLEHLPFARVANLATAMRVAKDAGLWMLGAAEEGGTDVAAVSRDRPWLLVLGNEEKGLRRLTRESCDEVCRIPARGPLGTLNVSAAAAVLMATLTAP
jgi:23S rRNA (guanosine2251-2'-O)-methyltransferase